MKDKERNDAFSQLSADELALLGALAAGPDEHDQRDGDTQALEGDVLDELAAHRALVSELRELPPRAPSPNWQQLEASIRQACDEVPAKRRWSWAKLRDAWRLPTLGLGAAAMASLALLLWARAPRSVESPLDVAPTGERLDVEQPVPSAPQLVATPTADDETAAMFLDEELIDDIDERGVDALVQLLPAEAALTLGATEDDSDDGEELLPSGSYDDEIERLDDEALRALGQWLDAEQKG